MKIKTRTNLVIVFLIGILALILASCAGTPGRHLPADASLIKQGQAEAELIELLGQPQAIRTNQAGRKEWYYYDVHEHFWQRIPVLGHYLGKKEVEALQIILDSHQVVKAVYYVQNI